MAGATRPEASQNNTDFTEKAMDRTPSVRHGKEAHPWLTLHSPSGQRSGRWPFASSQAVIIIPFLGSAGGAVSSSRPELARDAANRRGQGWPQATAKRREASLRAAVRSVILDQVGRPGPALAEPSVGCRRPRQATGNQRSLMRSLRGRAAHHAPEPERASTGWLAS